MKTYLFITTAFFINILFLHQSLAQYNIKEGLSGIEGDQLFIRGEVSNNSKEPIQSVRITVSLYDAGGNLLAVEGIDATQKRINGSDRIFTMRKSIEAGQKSPFQYKVAINRIKGKYASHKLSVTALPFTSPAKASVSNLKNSTENGTLTVTGTYQCQGGTCNNPTVVIAVYNDKDQLCFAKEVDLRQVNDRFSPVRSLSSGGQHPIEVKVYAQDIPKGHSIKRWALWASTRD